MKNLWLQSRKNTILWQIFDSLTPVILKDVTYSIMSELLQFMYQGEVNVKQSELQAFMTIAENLQIKGLATNSNSNVSNNVNQTKTSDSVNSSYNQFHHNGNNNGRNHNQTHYNSAGNSGNQMENHRQNTSTPSSVSSSVDNHSIKGENCANLCKIFVELDEWFLDR